MSHDNAHAAESFRPARPTGAGPGKVSARGWREILLRVKEEIGRDNLSLVAAGIGFYVMLSIVPALFAAVAIYGLVADPAAVPRAIAGLSRALPPSSLQLVETQLRALVQTAPTTLGWGAALGIVLALWSAAKGAKALIAGVNLADGQVETRGFFALQGLALAFTAGFVVVVGAAVGLLAVLPGLVDRLALGPTGAVVVFVVRWALLLALVLVALGLVYRHAPAREAVRWRWVSRGSFVATGLWVAASALFSWYVVHYGNFQDTYGALAGAVVLLLWLQISFFLVLLGAELNAAIERRRRSPAPGLELDS